MVSTLLQCCNVLQYCYSVVAMLLKCCCGVVSIVIKIFNFCFNQVVASLLYIEGLRPIVQHKCIAINCAWFEFKVIYTYFQ